MANAHLICSVAGCDKPAGVPGTSKEFCSAHYMRFRRHGDPLAGKTPHGEPLAWLRANVSHKGDECLAWPYGGQSHDGYGRVQYEGKNWVASRLMCFLAHGAPPENADAAHSCGNGHKGCVNPTHLSWKTRSDNHADKVDHGTATRGSNAPWAKLKESDVRSIRAMKGNFSQTEIAAKFNVSRSAVQDILRGRNWGWLN